MRVQLAKGRGTSGGSKDNVVGTAATEVSKGLKTL